MRYRRPTTIEEALEILTEPGSVILAGGTTAVPELTSVAAADRTGVLIDLQDLGLDRIRRDERVLRLGATTTLQQMIDAPEVPEFLAGLARREAPRTIRNMATVGGLVASAPATSELLAGLLVCGARLRIGSGDGASEVHIEEVLGSGSGGLITEIVLGCNGAMAHERVARTPADSPIVAAVARRRDDGQVRLALCGVAPTPVLVEPGAVAGLEPSGGFRGSSEYRRRLAVTLSERVLARIEDAGDNK